MKRAAIYVRVSTREQQKNGLSVDNQLDSLKEYCKKNKIKIAEIYNDAGISARKKYKKRPALLKLMNDCMDGSIDIILFTKLDRWFRSVADYYEVQSILDQYKVPWRAIWEDYETETSSGVFKVNIMLSVAQAEADRTSERTRDSVEYRRAQGNFLGGRPPLGYKLINKKLVIDETKRDVVNAIFETYLNTFSISAAVIAASNHGHRMATSVCWKTLNNTAYCGNAHGGSSCPSYITQEQHNIITESMRKKTRTTKHSDRVYIFSGLCTCGYCGSRMVGRVNVWTRKRDNVKKYNNFYSCSAHLDMRRPDCPGMNLSEKKIESYLFKNLNSIIEEHNISLKENLNDDNQNKIKNLELKLKRIGDRYELGDYSFSEYKDKRFELMAEIANLRNQSNVKHIIPALPDDWKDVYESLTLDNKKAFWHRLISEIIIDKNEKINVLFYA
ncbi:MAG: recombinase family protein [Lachnospira sp.]|nr:recombinase family protein [Lachnospira sp.]